MVSNTHATLSASSSARWLACPPSALLCAKVKDVTSTYAQQGTDAHELCEYKVRKMLGEDVENPIPNLEFYDAEMESTTDDYLNFVTEELAKIKQTCIDPLVLVEQKLDFSSYVPDGFGTGDCVIVSDDVLEIIDFKYGLGVLVSAEDNPQMKLYALGALEMFGSLYDINKIRMAIFQPRRENVSIYEISKADLLKWANEVLKPTAELASKGDG